MLLLFPDSPRPTPLVGGGAEGGERAEGGQGNGHVVQELWFIVVMAAIALLLLAIVLGVLLHKVRDLTVLSYPCLCSTVLKPLLCFYCEKLQLFVLLPHQALNKPPFTRERPPLVALPMQKRSPMAVYPPSNSVLVRAESP